MLFREYYALTRHSLSSVNASTYRYSWASIDTTSPVCWVNTVPHPLSAGRLFHIRHYTSFLVIPNSFTSKLVKSWNWIYCLISFNSAKLTVNGASGFELFVWWMLMVRHAHNSHQSMVNKMKHTLGINKNANRLPSVCECARSIAPTWSMKIESRVLMLAITIGSFCIDGAKNSARAIARKKRIAF